MKWAREREGGGAGKKGGSEGLGPQNFEGHY